MTEERDQEHRLYQVDQFKRIIGRESPPLTWSGRLFRPVANFFSSLGGFFLTLFAMMIVFAMPLFVISMALLYQLPGFIASYALTVGGLGFYVKRKVGRSIQFVEGNLGTKLVGSLIGYSLVIAVFYLVFVVILKK